MTTPVQVMPGPIDRVCEEIRVAMARKRWNQADLARELGVTEHWVSRRLRGHTDLSVIELYRIAAALGVSPKALVPDQVTCELSSARTFPPRRSLLPGDRPMRLTPSLAEAA